MAEGANVKVELDTRPAKKKLQELGKEGEATAGRIGTPGRGGGSATAGGGFGSSFTKGAVAGAGFGLASKIAGSVGVFGAFGDVASEAFSGVTSLVGTNEDVINARARKQTREEVVNQFAAQVGHNGDLSAARAMFNHRLSAVNRPKVAGAAAINVALGGPNGVPEDQKTPLDKLIEGVIGELKSGFQWIGSLMPG